MEIANCWLILDKYGADVQKRNITPAELVLLVKDRQDIIGKFPIHDLVVLGTAQRDRASEQSRLRYKYGPDRVDKKTAKIDVLYPGASSKYPETFAETGLLEQAQAKKMDVPVKGVKDLEDEPTVVETEDLKLTKIEETKVLVTK